MEEQLHKKRYHLRSIATYLLPVGWLILLLVVMNSTSPLKVGPAGILLIFIIFYMFVCSTLYVLTHTVAKVIALLTKKTPVEPRRIYYFVSIISLAPVFLVALNTLGQLGAQEVILVLVLVGIGCFYVDRRTRFKSSA